MASDPLDPYKRPIQFLLLVILFVATFSAIYILVFTNREQQYSLLEMTTSGAGHIIQSISLLFQFADHWNWMLLTFLFSLGISLLCINDIFLRRLITKRISYNVKDFWQGGFFWLLRICLNLSLFFLQVALISYLINIATSSPHIFSIDELKGDKYTVLLLGTSKYLHGTDNPNKYYDERINATIDLYQKGVVKEIIISGDHKGAEYSEPKDMKRDLVAGGVPGSVIQLDLKGFRTFDSIKRTKAIMKGENLVVVSQLFHLERALFMAKSDGIDAIGVAANGTMTLSMLQREMFAKTKVLLDIYILNTQAYGLQAHPRRALHFSNRSDIILLIFVICTVYLAGRLSRQLLEY